MSNRTSLFAVGCLVFIVSSLMATSAMAAPFKGETVTERAAIAPGPNVILNAFQWAGASRIHVYGQGDLMYKGSMPAGTTSQMTLSSDEKTLYVMSNFAKRIVYGPVESVVQVYDIETLSRHREFIVPNKAIKGNGLDQVLELSADESLLYVQNATPATSVTVVDLARDKVLQEVPLPGCFGIYPAQKGHRFSTLCGTGTIKTVTLKGDQYQIATSEKVFDADKTPWYIHATRRNDGAWIFTSYGGELILVDDSGETAKVIQRIALTSDQNRDWVPGGYGITAYSPYHDVVFITMHDHAFEGSHKDPSDEIWAYSFKAQKLISRSKAKGLVALVVTDGESPVIFGSNGVDNSVDKYVLDDKEKLTFKKAGSDKRAGVTFNLRLTGQ